MQVMLAGKVSDVNKLRYPVLASLKLDGVRAFVSDGVVYSRNFKPIPNVFVQKNFRDLPEGTDGELILGNPTAPDAYRKTVSAVMGKTNPEGVNVVLHVVDSIPGRNATDPGFGIRYRNYSLDLAGKPGVLVVKQATVWNAEELLAMEEIALADGHEGLMVRSLWGRYKHGRSTEDEGILLKLKRFVDSEAVVLDTVPLMHNDNEATENELGHTKRSTAKAGLVAQNALGKFVVRDCKSGVEFECGTGQGLTKELRVELWKDRANLVGKFIKYKFFPSGSKDRPRFPVWLGFRDKIDM